MTVKTTDVIALVEVLLILTVAAGVGLIVGSLDVVAGVGAGLLVGALLGILFVVAYERGKGSS